MTLRNDVEAKDFARHAARLNYRLQSHADDVALTKQHEAIHQNISKAGTTFDDLWYIGKSIGAFIRGVDPFIDAIPWLAVFATILSSLFRLSSTFLGKKSVSSRVLTVSASVAAIALGIAFLVVPVFTAAFIIATNVVDFFMSTWEFAHSTQSFRKERRMARIAIAKLEKDLIDALESDPIKFALFKKYLADTRKDAACASEYDSIREMIAMSQRLTQASNAARKAHGEYANTLQTYIVSTISRVASIVFFFFPPIGAALLLATGVYGILDRFNLNPFKIIGKKILGENNPFTARKHHFSIAQLQSRIKRHIPEIASTQHKLRANGAAQLTLQNVPANVPSLGLFSARRVSRELSPQIRAGVVLST